MITYLTSCHVRLPDRLRWLQRISLAPKSPNKISRRLGIDRNENPRKAMWSEHAERSKGIQSGLNVSPVCLEGNPGVLPQVFCGAVD